MSDGNFNRSLLPQGGYASGVRAGEARMKLRALSALDAVLAKLNREDGAAGLPPEVCQSLRRAFAEELK